jgi:hypothetical protein
MKLFYTYLWLREDGTPYYAGKAARIQRAFGGTHRVAVPSRENIIVQEWPNEKSALAAEVFLISYYGRLDLKTGCLANLTDGGEGTSGHKQSAETIEKRVSKIRGVPRPQHVLDALRAATSGSNHPSARAAGATHWNRGLKRSKKTRAKIRKKRLLQDMSSHIKSHCKRGHLRSPDNVGSNSTCLLCKKLFRHKGAA